MNKDQELRDLFTAERNRDQIDFPAPDVDDIMSNSKTISFKWYHAAAAVLVLGGLIGILRQSDSISGQDTVSEEITLNLDLTQTETTDQLMEENASLFSWEASTDVLIQEFDE
ncbi:hypothetical protein [Gilvibacter sp.]|uniref:hypothetical protein n=1 Tax=Gilvibacter sp. TaxID=2729997 RepID=UPI0025C42E04|nr:hypothetical protein [Gilvibacter sp.]NQX78685.1 hypothetical protein [Gilvibacter sp.]